MPFDWTDYLVLARSLNGEKEITCSEESQHRSAVSRAYYAAFCSARNYARDHYGFEPRYVADDHVNLQREYKNAARDLDGERKEQILLIASQLEHLRTWRNRCDYDDDHPNLPVTVRSAIREAQRLIEVLS